MDNLDQDSENNAKVSDSAYSNSCSNSQSRRSHSSKSTHSGSHSSRSSGYGGKTSSKTFSDNSGQPEEKRCKEKEVKQKKLVRLENTAELEDDAEDPAEHTVVQETIQEQIDDAVELIPPPQLANVEKLVEIVESVTPAAPTSIEEVNEASMQIKAAMVPLDTTTICTFTGTPTPDPDGGFSCVISMHDGVVMYTTSSLTSSLGFPKDMWIGRSFIDFVHARDRNTFASHITSGLSVPKNVNGTNMNNNKEVTAGQNAVGSMVCRIRKYRNLTGGFGVKEKTVSYMPFFLKLSFKNISDTEGKVTYLVIQATPFFSAFKSPNEVIAKATPFVIRHAANGNVEYIDPEAVQYLGFLPQDLEGKDALQLYHMADLPYLRQVYETIVREGGVVRSKPYRIMTQNWDFIKVETEWSSFINPWSKKLEFVVSKHCLLEGPANPDVFQPPKVVKPTKVNIEEMKRAQALRDSIIRIMTEALTKPAEVAKQHMTKRCQDLASFMENLIEENPPKTPADELHLEIQDPDSYYERDSEMLGGISPHHEYNDSMSSVETPLSYNQLNYNETLERYFDSHQPYSYEDYNTVSGENILGIKNARSKKETVSSMAQSSVISGEMSSSESGTFPCGNSPVPPIGDLPPIRLTESLIHKHNEEMEKELMKNHRITRSSSRGERKMVTKENKRKKKEHLERCNATFQPTSVANNPTNQTEQAHGVKRMSKPTYSETRSNKHHRGSTSRRSKKRQFNPRTSAQAQPSATATTTVAQTTPNQCWQEPNSMNTYIMGVAFPPQMPIMSPMSGMPAGQEMSGMQAMPGMQGMQAMPGMQAMQGMSTMQGMSGMQAMIPVYYTPISSPIASTSAQTDMMRNVNSIQYQQPMPCMMYGQAVYGSPMMYSPMNPQLTYNANAAQNMQSMQSMYSSPSNHPLGLAASNYEEACKLNVPELQNQSVKDKWHSKVPLLPSGWEPSATTSGAAGNRLWRKKQLKNQVTSNRSKGSGSSNFSSSNTFSRSFDPSLYSDGKSKGSGDDTVDRTDGESSYSSFYSSFFRTEASGSQDEYSDAQKMERALGTKNTHYVPPSPIARRKTDPPWTEQVCVTSELVYKYQIRTRNIDDVLKADKAKMNKTEQPSLVNDQLGQLYLDLQLEGVAARLTLEEGITSSSGSSGEEGSSHPNKTRRKRNFNKLAIFYEEDAPFPPTPVESPTPVDSRNDTAMAGSSNECAESYMSVESNKAAETPMACESNMQPTVIVSSAPVATTGRDMSPKPGSSRSPIRAPTLIVTPPPPSTSAI
ncbi:hypothetical protein O0L34_g2714 [Tuta absoluta]|nr:hypothetical protein O0L34_g2714 [Tuta absoluta]